jgi:hypothetical protein
MAARLRSSLRGVRARPAPSAAATRSRSAQALEAPYVEDTYVALDRDRRHAAPVAFAESYAAPAFGRISTGDQYVASLRGRDLPVYLFGENIDEFVDHPIVWPSVNAVAETYRLAEREPELATVYSSLIGGRVHRFAHICESAEDVVAQNRMQRKMGQLTGTCFQRCVGQDCMNASWTTTHLIDAAHGTAYQARLKAFVQHVQSYNLTVGGAMTDPKGDRSKPPHAQEAARNSNLPPDVNVRRFRRTLFGRASRTRREQSKNRPNRRRFDREREVFAGRGVPLVHVHTGRRTRTCSCASSTAGPTASSSGAPRSTRRGR